MSAPIFILAGTVVGALINWVRKPNDAGATRWRASLGIALLPLSVEGVIPRFEFDRDERVSVTESVAATPVEIRAALARPPRFDRELPAFLRLGFPVPSHPHGAGLEVGAQRSVTFAHGEHHSGALVMAVSAVDSASVTFSVVSDSSYVTHWLAWQGATVEWRPAGDGRTDVTWTLRYRRRLDPAWYFAPLERYGVRLAASYLAETLATPETAVSERR